jgi:hypothetical protein
LRGEGAETKYFPKIINLKKCMSKISGNVILSKSQRQEDLKGVGVAVGGH